MGQRRKKADPLQFQRRWLAPDYWPIWALAGLMWCLAHLPWRWQMAFGAGLGRLLYHVAADRRHVADTNMARVFPELDDAARRARVKAIFAETGKGLPETCVAWFGDPRRLRVDWQVEQIEPAIQALQDGQGALFVGAHFSCIDICGAYMGTLADFDTLHRPHNNPLLNYFQHRGRLRFVGGLVDRRDMRGMVRRLRQGRGIFYAPDQDLGRKRATAFVPFFGIPAATVEATSRLVTLSEAKPFLVLTRRHASGYHIRLEAAPQIATGDLDTDLRAYNEWLEARIRETPEQYLWLHKRFKTRPPGEPAFYGVKGK
ncbi:lipid A biosynthesis lauroyl acyltransferase [Natronospirillum operosum]|uniref:Lipid A biosynthesis lauroyl acyltransferase n=1 Tax=Natronospirillum operosum TaxID=2759953 RepID=A0A4Z0W9V6_9GAMM|nr:lysophospholipid acyltransferase family protein [Natronospirillum operosum]TGG92923.1 lipid A biosynthesis lauroyl acyltransferase [Natronospirillum operosum]